MAKRKDFHNRDREKLSQLAKIVRLGNQEEEK
jgi:hypothetical protein